MTEIPRDPSHYSPTVHAIQRKRDRGIGWHCVADTISDGEMNEAYKDNCKLFIKEFSYEPRPIGVVVDYEKGDVLTVEYRNA